jgi:hypothetical protein
VSNVFLTNVRALIDVWCERRALKALHYVLGPYLGFVACPLHGKN